MSDALLAAVGQIRGVTRAERRADGGIHVESTRDVRLELTRTAAQQGAALLELHQSGGDLEEIYRKYFEKAGEQDDVTATEPDRLEKARRSLGQILRQRAGKK